MADNISSQEATKKTVTDISGSGTLIVNVGGVIFETYRSTLLRMSNGPLVDDNILKEHFRPEKNDYFFDRDPDAFKIVLNTLRTGGINIPPGIYDSNLKNELTFWGLTPGMNQPGIANLTQTSVSTGNTEHVGANSGSTNRENTGNKIWNILSNPSTSLWAKLYAGLSYFLMCLSVVILVAETTPLFHVPRPIDSNSTHETSYRGATPRRLAPHYAVETVALVCCLFFVIEYILRLVFAPNRLRFVFSFLGVIDLLAALPEFVMFLLSFFVEAELSIFRIFRIFRILRMLRVFKHFRNMMKTRIIVHTLKSSVGELVLLLSLMAIGVLVWGTLVYSVEDREGDVYYRSKFETIPEACWWAIVTMTTVGYGDIVPLSYVGKIMGSLCAMSGLLLIGLCISVLVNNMIKVCSKLENITVRK